MKQEDYNKNNFYTWKLSLSCESEDGAEFVDLDALLNVKCHLIRYFTNLLTFLNCSIFRVLHFAKEPTHFLAVPKTGW